MCGFVVRNHFTMKALSLISPIEKLSPLQLEFAHFSSQVRVRIVFFSRRRQSLKSFKINCLQGIVWR